MAETERCVYKFSLKVSNVGVSYRERGRMFQETAVKEEKVQEPTVDSLVHGIRKVSVGGGECE